MVNRLGAAAQLERIFHTSHTHGWNGPDVVRQAVAARDNSLSDVLRRALAVFAADLSEVECATWTTCMRLALTTDNLEAKLAATAQAADEANHFRAVQTYLESLRMPECLPDSGLVEILAHVQEAPLDEVLAIMQLTVENAADHLFRQIGIASADVVLSKLFSYISRDEHRHVAFAEIYLNTILPSPDDESLSHFAARWGDAVKATLAWLERRREDFAPLGIDLDQVRQELIEDLAELGELSATMRALVPAVLARLEI